MLPINRLRTDRVNPRLEEVQTFQSASKANGVSGSAASMDDFLSDLDEWDVLDDETLKKTIDDVDGGYSLSKRFEIGDNVEAISGQYKSIKGHIIKELDSNLGKWYTLVNFLTTVLIKSSDKSGMELKAWTKDLKKYFETGENVLVISGLHSGGSGLITAI